MPGTQPYRERLAVHARQLAFEPHLRLLRQPPRSLLRGLEQTCRSALADHVHQVTQLGSGVLIIETWYKLRGRIENVLDAARSRGFRDGPYPATWRVHLKTIL